MCMLRFKLVPRLSSYVTNYESQIVFMSSKTIKASTLQLNLDDTLHDQNEQKNNNINK